MLRSTIRSIGVAAVLFGGLIFGPTPLWAQGPQGAQGALEPGGALTIPRVDRAPRIDVLLSGNGDSPDAGLRVTDFLQREPGDGVPVSQATTAYLSYDDANLYVVFVCKDDRAKVRARIARREEISADDLVAVYLDTFLDRQHAYIFMSNPLGIQQDGILTEGQDEDWSFDTVWASEGRLTDDGYVVRMAIPFRSLRFRNDLTQTWNVAIGRVIRRNNEEAYWPLITKRVQGFVPQLGTVSGFAQISPGRNIQVNPYAAAAGARFLDADAAAFDTAREGRIGMDAKVVIRDALTVDGTVNPDFSQVESDDPQVTVNERFEVFFPEKRPFFIENAGYLQTPINLFFSRRLVDPGVGVRLTGKLGRWGLGAIAMNDRAPGRLPTDDPLAGKDAGAGVFRLSYGEDSNVGLFMSDLEFAGSSNRMVALDGRWRAGGNWVVAGQFARSADRELKRTRSIGNGAMATALHEGRNFEYVGNYQGFSPDFAAPLGFVKRVGFHQMDHEAKYRWRPEDKALQNYGPQGSVLYNWDWQGRLQDREIRADFQFEFVGNSEIKYERVEAFELFEESPFDLYANVFSAKTELLKWLGVGGSYARGTSVNHDPAPGLDPSLGRASEAEVSFTLRPTTQLRFDQAFVYSSLRTLDGSAPVFTEGQLRMKLNYQFNRLLSLRAIVDYANLDGHPTLADIEDERSWTSDLLLTYLVNPGTALYIGYTDRRENFEVVPGPFPTLRRTGSTYTSVGRQVFVKLSYLWRL